MNPIFETWQFLTYAKYLLDKPNRNSKKKIYEKCFEEKVKDSKYTKENLNQEATSVMNTFKKDFTR